MARSRAREGSAAIGHQPPARCFACGEAPIGECSSCGQPYCARHTGVAPRADWCSECVANAQVENALDFASSGCLAGFVLGIVLLVVLLSVAPSIVYGAGRGFVIVVGSAIVGALIAYLRRRARPRRGSASASGE